MTFSLGKVALKAYAPRVGSSGARERIRRRRVRRVEPSPERSCATARMGPNVSVAIGRLRPLIFPPPRLDADGYMGS